MKSLLACVSTCVALTSAAPVTLDSAMELSGAPGAVVALPGEPIKAVGSADWERTRPMTVDMRFRIGSVTKLFIGNVILKLRDQGKLSLDDTIDRYVREVPNGDRITLRQLGNHTSGLPDAIRNQAFQKAIVAEPGREWRADEILRFAFEGNKALPAPGTKWSYTNTNTILLALAAEKVTGTPWPQLLQREILTPLGLEDTSVPADARLPLPHPPAYRHGKPAHPIGYGKIRFDVTGYSASWTHAAGNMISTAGDLRKAAKALCEGSLLNEDSRRELHAWVPTGVADHRYGFCIESWNGFTGHRGDVPGFQAVVAIAEGTGNTFVILTNLSNTPDGEGPANTLLKTLTRGGTELPR